MLKNLLLYWNGQWIIPWIFFWLQESLCAYSAEAISLFKRAIMLSKVASLILPNLFTTINWLKE